MPTYEYKCHACEEMFELFQSITSKPKTKCPKCGKTAKRLISSGAGFLFKGSGFYTTDYRSRSYKAGEKKEKTPPSTGSSDKTSNKKN